MGRMSRQFNANLAAALRGGEAGAVRALAGVGQQIATAATSPMSAPPPSAPGGPPAVITGRLRASYRSEVRRDRVTGRYYVAVYSTAPYASIVEFGTSRQAPRPSLRPAVNVVAPSITPAIAKGWESGVRSGARRR